ncbi:MAG: Ribonuclease 3 [Chlamydiales bacterium]|nr:Ribonuclease 3 [Chlamydiales bacterium]MCH9619956.1 Ribonuclease 3 [Chlamydiales bacterium]MCH9622617.1 Ribonuclease 3 [Chlamydiales bacterium]
MKDFFPFLTEIEKKLGYSFQDPNIIALAFSHRSFWNEQKEEGLGHNERLEFLGDSVLGLLVAQHLYLNCPQVDEGELSRMKSQLVDATACASYVQKLGIETYLLLGKGEQMNRGKGRESILADLFEAVIGALFLDSDYERVKAFFFSHFEKEVQEKIERPAHNWKAELQDYTQKNYQKTPIYEVVEQIGPEHEKHFKVAVLIEGQKLGEGVGSSKKEAQVMAAKDALEKL